MLTRTLFRRRSRLALWSCLAAMPVMAGPMGFQDSWMAMGDTSPNWREVFVNYAVTSRDAVGLSQTYMRSDDDEDSRDLAEFTYTRLVKRWNLPEAQGNIWFAGGAGKLYRRDGGGAGKSSAFAISPGIQADYETPRIYFSAMHRLYRARDINHDYSAARAGFSFFESAYEETQPWLIVEARHMNDLSDQVEITPLLRLINRSYFIEAGVNNSAQPRFNFMLIF